jgi:hypothetical protein
VASRETMRVEQLQNETTQLQLILRERDTEIARLRQWRAIEMDDDGLNEHAETTSALMLADDDGEQQMVKKHCNNSINLVLQNSSQQTLLPTSLSPTSSTSTAAQNRLSFNYRQLRMRLRRLLHTRQAAISISFRVLLLFYSLMLHFAILRCFFW